MKRPRSNRRFPFSEVIRAAYLAGSGATAEEIADALGGSWTASRVYALLRRHGMRLVPKTVAQASFPLVISRESLEKADRVSGSRGCDPYWLMGRLVESALRDRQTIDELLGKLEART